MLEIISKLEALEKRKEKFDFKIKKSTFFAFYQWRVNIQNMSNPRNNNQPSSTGYKFKENVQNLVFLRAPGIFRSLYKTQDDHAYLELWHSQNRLFKHFQRYLGIFTDIDAYSGTLTGAQLVGRGEASPALLENSKK